MDNDRRQFLKILLIGSGTLLAGKVLGPLFSVLLDSKPSGGRNAVSDSVSEGTQNLFKVVENKKRLSIYDNSGEEVFQIDNGDDM